MQLIFFRFFKAFLVQFLFAVVFCVSSDGFLPVFSVVSVLTSNTLFFPEEFPVLQFCSDQWDFLLGQSILVDQFAA